MQILKIAVRTFCVIAFLTSAADMLNGIGLLVTAGAPVSSLSTDAVLNSQVRFWGAIWFGFGVILWRASSRLVAEAELFKLLCGIIGLSGFARVASVVLYGLPGAVLTGAMVLELTAAVGFYFWHASLLKRRIVVRSL